MTLPSQHVSVGERLPFLAGAGAGGTFYSLDGQAGRPVALLLLGKLPPDRALPLLSAFEREQAAFASLNADAVALASLGNGGLAAYAASNPTRIPIVFCASDDIFAVARDEHATTLVVDRSGRLTSIIRAGDAETAIAIARHEISLLPEEPGRVVHMSAPVLIVPNLIDREFCRELMGHFESGEHLPGVMASANGKGDGYAKMDAGKKHRRDLVLDPRVSLHARVAEVLARRLVPEIKRAFQADLAHLDRILIARYDDNGGYFHRHRDDAAPAISYRQFALSLNLNTGEYEGGHLRFPEFTDDLVSPPAGAAAVFSASLLHEATAVTSGRRYVLLTFLHGHEAEARRLARLRQSA